MTEKSIVTLELDGSECANDANEILKGFRENGGAEFTILDIVQCEIASKAFVEVVFDDFDLGDPNVLNMLDDAITASGEDIVFVSNRRMAKELAEKADEKAEYEANDELEEDEYEYEYDEDEDDLEEDDA